MTKRALPMDDTNVARDQFLDLLAEDVASHPERLEAIDTQLVRRIRSLTVDVDADIDAPLEAIGATTE